MEHFGAQRFETETEHETHVPILSNLVGWLRGPPVHHHTQTHTHTTHHAQHPQKADPLQITVQPTSATAAPAQQAGGGGGGMMRSKSAAFNMSSLGLGSDLGSAGFSLPAQSGLKQRSQSHHQDPLQGSFSLSSFLPYAHPYVQTPSPSSMGPRVAPSSGSSQHPEASPPSSAPNSRGQSPAPQPREKISHAPSEAPMHLHGHVHVQPHHPHRPCTFKL